MKRNVRSVCPFVRAAGPPRLPRRLAAGSNCTCPPCPGSISTSATSRPPLFVPHQADMKLLPLSVLKLRLFEFAVRGRGRRLQRNVCCRVDAGAVIEIVQLRAGAGIGPTDLKIDPAKLPQRQFDRDRTGQLPSRRRRCIPHRYLDHPRQRTTRHLRQFTGDPGRFDPDRPTRPGTIRPVCRCR